eukprot:Opistho-2@75698
MLGRSARLAGAVRPVSIIAKRPYSAAVSQYDAYPGVPCKGGVEPASQNVTIGKTRNGITVATQPGNGPAATVAVFVEAGSRHECNSTLGISHYLRALAFKSTANRTAFRITREFEANGVNLYATGSREHLAVVGEGLADSLEPVVETLGDIVQSAVYHPWEIRDANALVELEASRAAATPQVAVIESLHRAVFKGELGNGLYCPEHSQGAFKQADLAAFRAKTHTAGRIIIVGAGVAHEDLVSLVNRAFAGVPAGAKAQPTPAQYKGAGDVRTWTKSDVAHFALAFSGVSASSPDLPALQVLQSLLGTGSNIKRGSGISRLSVRGRKAFDGHFDLSAFSASYSDAGLFGIYGISEAANAGKLVEAAVAELQSVAAGKFAPDEVERAKRQSKNRILMNAETRNVAVEDIGRQVGLFGTFTNVAEAVKAIDGISAEKLSQVASRVLKGSTPTLVAHGDLRNIPVFDGVKF